MCTILRQVSKNNVQELPKGTEYIRKGIADNGLSIHEILVKHIEKNAAYFAKNYIQNIPEYKKDDFIAVALQYIQDTLEELNQQLIKRENEFKSLTTDAERQESKNQYERQKNNLIAQQKENIFNSNLSTLDKLMLKISNRWKSLKDNTFDKNIDDVSETVNKKVSLDNFNENP